MNKLKLSVLATACILALTACSSGKGKGGDYLNGEANKRIQELNARVDEAKKQVAAAEQKAKEAEKASETALNQQKAEATAQANKAAEEAKAELDKVTAEKAAVEKELADAKAQLAAIEKAKQDELDRAAAAEKAEQERVANNVAETKKQVKDNGTFEKKYMKPGDPWFGTAATEVTLNLSNVVGKQLSVADGNFTHQDVVAESRDLNTLVVNGKEIALYSVDEVKASVTNNSGNYVTKSIDAEGVSGKVGSLSKSRFGSDFDQVRYGYVTENGKTTLFVQGHTTPATGSADSPFDRFNYGGAREDQYSSLSAMPTGEKVWAYTGTAFYGKDGSYQELSVDAVADFNLKKVKAELKDGDSLKLTLGGLINDNTFTGEYNGVVTSGAFYGDQAQDLGGVFYQTTGNDKDKNGVFGATSNGHSWRGGVNVPEKALTDFDVK